MTEKENEKKVADRFGSYLIEIYFYKCVNKNLISTIIIYYIFKIMKNSFMLNFGTSTLYLDFRGRGSIMGGG